MRRRTEIVRALVGLGVLAVCGVALVAVGMSAPPLPSAPEEVAQTDTLLRTDNSSHQWTLSIDGWRLEFDGVKAVPLDGIWRSLEEPPDADSGDVDSAEDEGAAIDADEFRSPYDHLIAKHAKRAGMDWRLVSAVIFEESHFRASSESEAGARGLMQISSIAAREVGEAVSNHPDTNIRTGVRYLKHLGKMFPATIERDRLALLLAAYNMGPGHVQDAQALAKRFGYDPLRWDDSVDKMIPLLERPAFYGKLPNGFAHGRKTVKYVNRVLDRFTRSRRALGPTPDTTAMKVDHAASASG